MPTTFTPQQINSYWKAATDIPYDVESRDSIFVNGQKDRLFDPFHPYFIDAVLKADAMATHADGQFPWKLLRERRPNEPDEVVIYRQQIWKPKTKPTFNKVMSSLQKIRRSADWMIKYPDDSQEQFTRINEEETLQQYCEFNLPYFTSVTNWVFSLMLRKYLIDPNAIVFVTPIDESLADNEFIKPYPVIVDSINVLDYVEDSHAVLFERWGATYYVRNQATQGKRMIVVTTDSVTYYDQIDNQGNYSITTYSHNLGLLPCFKLGGTLVNQTSNYFLFESRIAGMIPELDEAVREYSDLQAAKVLHIFPERWEYANIECASCNGRGLTVNPDYTNDCNCPAEVTCNACGGSGYPATGPYAKKIVKAPNTALGETGGVPIPPAGFIEKDVTIIKLAEESVEKHLADALAAINFEFLVNVPLSTTGISKQYDRNESNNTSHAVAEDLVAGMDKIYKIIARYRYGFLYNDDFDLIDQMLPTIPVPENYDLYSIADAQAELNSAKTANTNPLIVTAMEVDFANKRFSADPAVKDRLNLIFQLDPLPNISEDNKMSRLSNKGITQEAYVISSNIQQFVQQAIEDDPDFAAKPIKEQQATMKAMAKLVTDANSAQAKVIKMATPALTGIDQNGNPLPNTPPPALIKNAQDGTNQQF